LFSFVNPAVMKNHFKTKKADSMKKWPFRFKSDDSPKCSITASENPLSDSWKSFFNHFPDFVIQVNRSNKILYINRPITGKLMNQIIGTDVLNHLQQINGEKIRISLEKAFTEGKESVYELKEPNTDEWFLVRIAPMLQDVTNPSVFLFVTNISAKKLIERELVGLSEIFSSRMEIKRRVITTLSHELNNPMHVIQSYTNFLDEGNLTNEQKQAIMTIKNSSKNLSFILDEILDFSRIITGHFSLNQSDFNLDDLVKQVISYFESDAEQKNIILRSHNFHLVKASLSGDKERLKQVLVHLIGNAIKFSVKGRVDVILKLLKQDSKYLKFEIVIKDTGIGIEAQNVERVFRSFAQEDEKISRQYGGLGLGLTICKQIIDLMEGDLRIISEKGVGSTISITLSLPISNNPVRRMSNVEQLLNNDEIKEQISKIQVLLVEDEPEQQKIAIKVLDGWNVTVAGNGEVATELLRQREHYDIILMDIRMPVMDGMEATKLIRSELKINTPIIAVSGEAFVESAINECKAAGMDDFVPKPYEKSVLIDSILRNLKNITLTFTKKEIIDPSQLLQGKKVMYVEDDEINQKVTRRMLEKLGCEIEIAKDGVSAIDKAKFQSFDVLLLDLNLPDMSGFEVAKKIREMNIISPILAYSGDDDQETRDKLKEIGVDDLLTKPQRDHLEMGLKINEVINKSKNRKLYDFDFLINKTFKEDEIPELVNDFLQKTVKSINNLSKSLDENDLKLLRNTAHTLKTSFFTFGIQSVRTSLILLEEYADNLLANGPTSDRLNSSEIDHGGNSNVNKETVVLLINKVRMIFEEVGKQLETDFKIG